LIDENKHLDHRYKGLGLLKALYGPDFTEQNAIHQQYENMLNNLMIDAARNVLGRTDQPVVEAVVVEEEEFEDLIKPSKSTLNLSEHCQAEFQKFKDFHVPVADKALHPFSWWPKYCQEFPILAIVVLALFTIPGSQNDVERVFSIAGYLAGIRRSQMSTEMLEMLVFINQNFPDELVPNVTEDDLLLVHRREKEDGS